MLHAPCLLIVNYKWANFFTCVVVKWKLLSSFMLHLLTRVFVIMKIRMMWESRKSWVVGSHVTCSVTRYIRARCCLAYINTFHREKNNNNNTCNMLISRQTTFWCYFDVFPRFYWRCAFKVALEVLWTKREKFQIIYPIMTFKRIPNWLCFSTRQF